MANNERSVSSRAVRRQLIALVTKQLKMEHCVKEPHVDHLKAWLNRCAPEDRELVKKIIWKEMVDLERRVRLVRTAIAENVLCGHPEENDVDFGG